MALSVGSLFSGIGGIDLGLERAGMDTRWFVEIDPHCRNVLARHWPGLPIYGDITAIDWSGVEPVDVLAGGFPCQPVSVAGRALAQADVRWLWPAFRDAIGALRPRYVLVENVPGLLQRGLGIVLADLAQLGYDAEWECIPAAAVGAPHLRNRLWLVAYRPEMGSQESAGASIRADLSALWRERFAGPSPPGRGSDEQLTSELADSLRLLPYAPPLGDWQARQEATRFVSGMRSACTSLGLLRDTQQSLSAAWLAVPGQTQDWLELAACRGVWASEWPGVPRVSRERIPKRVPRLRALGNAVVPQVVEWIGRRIVAFDEGRVSA